MQYILSLMSISFLQFQISYGPWTTLITDLPLSGERRGKQTHMYMEIYWDLEN